MDIWSLPSGVNIEPEIEITLGFAAEIRQSVFVNMSAVQENFR